MVLLVMFLLGIVTPARAGERDVDVRDLKGISPKRHKHLFSVIGGAAVGAGIGLLLGSGNDVTKGLFIGAGGASAVYLHSHRTTGGAYRDWLFIGTHTALGTGLGWTICGCDDGVIGGGGSAIWRAMAPHRGITTMTSPGNKP